MQQIEEANRAYDRLAEKINKANAQRPTIPNDLPSKAREAAAEGSKLNNIFARTGGILAGVFATQQIGAFVQQVASVRGQFQQLEISFTTMLGSAHEAERLMGQLTETAAKTPFDLQGVANSAKNLLAYGFAADQVNDTLVRLGDVASGLSQPLGDIVYLYGSLRASGRVTNIDIRQFANRGIPIYEELAKVLGVTQDKINELVAAGKVGFPHIEEAFRNMTSEGGRFANLMQEQSKSITGQISNLSDAFDMMLNDIGKQSEGIISGSISVVASLVEHYEQVGRVLVGLIATYGVYRTALIANIALTKSDGVAKLISTNATRAYAAAQALLNKTMLANPYVLAATALAGVVAMMWAFHDSTTASERAQEAFNRQQEEAKQKADEHRRAVEELISVATNDALATFEREAALGKLRDFYPNIFAQYDIEKLKLTDILHLKQEIAKADGLKREQEQADYKKKVEDEIENLKRDLKNAPEFRAISGGFGMFHYSASHQRTKSEIQEKLKQKEAELTLINHAEKKQLDIKRQSKEAIAKLTDEQIKAEINAIERLKHKIKKSKKDINGHLEGANIYSGSYSLKEWEGKQAYLQNILSERNKEYESYSTRKRKTLDEAKKAEQEYHAFIKLSAEQLKEWSRKNGYKDPRVHEQELKTNMEEARKRANAFAEKGSRSSTSSTDPLRKKREEERLRREAEDQAKALAKARRDVELDIQMQEIDLKEEGFAKEQALINLQYERAKDAVIARGEEMIRLLQEQKRREWEATHDSNKEVYIRPTLTTNDLSQEDKSVLSTLEEQARKKHELDSEKLLKSLLGKYKDYEAQKQEIHRQFDQDRKAIEHSQSLSIEEKNRHIIELERQRGEAIKRVDEDIFEHTKKNNALMVDLFRSKSELTIKQMKQTIKAAEQALDYVRTTSPNKIEGQTFAGGYTLSAEDLRLFAEHPEKLKAITDGVKNLKSELGNTSPIHKFAMEMEQAIGKMQKGIDSGKGDFLGEGLSEVGQATQSLIPTIKELGKSMSAIFGSEMGEQIDDVADAIGALGGIASGVGQLIAGNPLGAMQIISSLGSIFEKSNKIAEENRKKELRALQELTRAQHEYNMALWRRTFLYEQGNTIFGSDAYGKMINDVKLANEALKQMNTIIKGNERDIAKIQIQGLNPFTNELRSLTKRQRDYAGLASLQIKDGTWTDGGLFGTGLWARTHDSYKSLLDVYPELISRTGEFNIELAKSIASTREFKDGEKDALEQAIKSAEQHEEAMKSLKQGLTNIFGSLGQKIGDELVEAFKRGEDAGKAFSKSIGQVFESFIKQIAYNVALAKPLEEASKRVIELQEKRSKGELTDDQLIEKTGEALEVLGDQLESNKALYEKVLERAKDVGNKKGFEVFSSQSDSRTSSAKGIAQASQESIDTMVGQGNTMIIQGDKMIAVQERIAKAIVGLQLHRLSDITQKSYQELALIRELTERVESNTASIKSIGQDFQRNGIKLSR